MIYINKILPIIVSPLGFITVLLFFGILRKKMLPSFVGLMTLLILSLPIVSGQLIKLLEKSYTHTTANEIASANLDFIHTIGLKEQLSVTRANGLLSMIKQIKLYALALNK